MSDRRTGVEEWEAMQQRAKPPLGVMPKILWRESRAQELARALHDHLSMANQVPAEILIQWQDELGEHLRWLRDHPPPDEIDLRRVLFKD